MADYNLVLIMGNLTRDPELRYTPSGSAVCGLGVAIIRKYQTRSGETREDTCFVDVDVWDRQAENCSRYLHKGDPVFVEGRLKMDEWEDRQTGQRRSRLKVQAVRVQFLSGPNRGGDGGGYGQGQPQSQGSYGQGGGGYDQRQAPPPRQQPPPPRPSGPPQPPQNNNAPPFPANDQRRNAAGPPDAFDVEDEDESIDDIPF